ELTEDGAEPLVRAVTEARDAAIRLECGELMAFATSSVREAINATEVLREVHERTGVDLEVLSGPDEARLTFLAVRRWFGWSAGRLLVRDIGGGSLEVAIGADEDQDDAISLPQRARRLTGPAFRTDPP